MNSAPGDDYLRIERVRKEFDGFVAVDDVSFTWELFAATVNKDLADTLGNFAASAAAVSTLRGETRIVSLPMPAAFRPVTIADVIAPVTDAMLQQPDPADWLMWRRTLDSWGHSPLEQIDRRNVVDLRLVWTRALGPGMQEGTPLVHDGVLSSSALYPSASSSGCTSCR